MAENNIEPEAESNLRKDLEEKIAAVDDVTDPSSMDILLEYVEKIRHEDDAFMELLTETCKNEVIYWEQPWYQEKYPQIHIRDSSLLASQNVGVTYRTDHICSEEHELIKKNWRKFIKKYKLPDKIISFGRWKNYKLLNPTLNPVERARRFTTAYLSRGLQRINAQVFQHIAAIAGYRKGNYTEIDDKIIEICLHHKPKLMATFLGFLLNRQRRGIFLRLKYLNKGKPPKKRLKWTLPLASKFINLLLERTQLELKDLKYRQIDPSIWRKMEDDIGQNRWYLHRFWYCVLHVQLFVKCDVKLRKVNKKLFKMLRDKARDSIYRVWSDIRWKELVLDFPDGFTYRFLYLIGHTCINNFKGYTKIPLIDVAEHALKTIKQQKEKFRNKRLRRLTLNSAGQLERVN